MCVWSFMIKNNFKLNSRVFNIIKVVRLQCHTSS
jgi:hypothetical protein